MHAWDPKKGRISLEDASVQANGGSPLDRSCTEHLEVRLQEAREARELKRPPPAAPVVDPTEVLLDAISTVGKSAANMMPEDRVVAQRLVSAGLEMLVCGGSLIPENLVDQLGCFAGIMEANSLRRLKVEEVENWYSLLSRPLESLLGTLLTKGVLQSSRTDGREVYSAVEDSQQCLSALRRFFDPAATRAGVDDALRRATNRVQRLRPQPSFGSSARASRSSLTRPRTTMILNSTVASSGAEHCTSVCIEDANGTSRSDNVLEASAAYCSLDVPNTSRASTPSTSSSVKGLATGSVNSTLSDSFTPSHSSSTERFPTTKRSSSLAACGSGLVAARKARHETFRT